MTDERGQGLQRHAVATTAYHYLDLVPKGRDEAALASPQDWVRHHDRYED